MRSLVVLAIVAALLSGCAQRPNPNTDILASDVARPVEIPAGQAAVVIGMTVSHPPVAILGLAPDAPAGMGWIAIDQHTGLRTGVQLFGMALPCGPFNCKAAGGDRTDYQLLVLPAGTYSMAWVADNLMLFHTAVFREAEIFVNSRDRITAIVRPSLEARVAPVAPTFTVQAGEIAYVGDLSFDFSIENEVRWSHAYDDATVRAFLAKTGLADRVVREKMTRASGDALKSGDAMMIKK